MRNSAASFYFSPLPLGTDHVRDGQAHYAGRKEETRRFNHRLDTNLNIFMISDSRRNEYGVPNGTNFSVFHNLNRFTKDAKNAFDG